MNITGVNQISGTLAMGQSNQDSHEMNIQKQIVTLQEKMRGIAYDSEMSAEEKSNEKKVLQEKIQSLNSELRQYQIQKRQEEAEKRQKEAERKRQEEAGRETDTTAAAADTSAKADRADASADTASLQAMDGSGTGAQEMQTDSQPESGTIISVANTKEHLANMQKIRTSLEGQMRTAPTDEEKAKLQKKLNNVSKGMGEKMQKISDTIANAGKEEKARREKVQKQLKEYRDRTKNLNTSVSKTESTASAKSGYRKDSSAMPGKVLITRVKA